VLCGGKFITIRFYPKEAYMRRTIQYLIGVGIVLLGCGAGLAVSLSPGGNVTISGSEVSSEVFVYQDIDRPLVLLDSSNDPVATVTVRDRVGYYADGDVTFERFLLNGPASPLAANPSIFRYDFSETGFTGFSTDVDFDPSTDDGLYYATNVSRTSDGNTVTFNDPFSPTDVINSGEQTDYLRVDTDAPYYALDAMVTVTGSIANVGLVHGSTEVFGPAVPEPSALAMLLCAAIPMMKRRR
jgi:hypothetical protein